MTLLESDQTAMAHETSLNDLEDSDLIAMAKKDPKAFGALYERYVKRIYNYVYYRTSSQAEAEDLTARVFQRALQHIPRYEDRGVPFSAWLYRIAHNLVVNWHRDRSRRQMVNIDDLVLTAFNVEAPEAAAERSEETELLMLAVRRLPEDRQQLLVLKFVERLPNAEIGDIMGRSEGAIKSLYHRTLIALRRDIARLRTLPPDEREDW